MAGIQVSTRSQLSSPTTVESAQHAAHPALEIPPAGMLKQWTLTGAGRLRTWCVETTPGRFFGRPAWVETPRDEWRHGSRSCSLVIVGLLTGTTAARSTIGPRAPTP